MSITVLQSKLNKYVVNGYPQMFLVLSPSHWDALPDPKPPWYIKAERRPVPGGQRLEDSVYRGSAGSPARA